MCKRSIEVAEMRRDGEAAMIRDSLGKAGGCLRQQEPRALVCTSPPSSHPTVPVPLSLLASPTDLSSAALTQLTLESFPKPHKPLIIQMEKPR